MLHADTPMAGMPAEDYQTLLVDLVARLTPVLQAQAIEVVTAALDVVWQSHMTATEWGWEAARHLGIQLGAALDDDALPD